MQKLSVLVFVLGLMLVGVACEDANEIYDDGLPVMDCDQPCDPGVLRDPVCGPAQYCMELSDWEGACRFAPTRCVEGCVVEWSENADGERLREGDSCGTGLWCNQNTGFCEARSNGGGGTDVVQPGPDVTEPEPEPDVTEPDTDLPDQPPVDLPCDDCEPVIQEVCCYWAELPETPDGETVYGQFSYSSSTELDPEAWEGVRDRDIHDGWACGYADLKLVTIGYWTALTVCLAQDAEAQIGNCRWVTDMPPQECTIDDVVAPLDQRLNPGRGFAVGDFAEVPYDDRY
ncbi:TPA: hypothetical protein DF272_05645 [Candidatus Falkowbacteria bacterium]|nr:hypothetical protein [Candidatus Falkowbacteria bacterium]